MDVLASARNAATARTPGFDVARAMAVLGMVLVNFRGKTHAEVLELSSLAWMMDRIEGKAAALFVVLAGVGISLRTRRARAEGGARLGFERRAQVERALILMGLGLLNLHLWSWDILHFYGVYLLLAVPLLTVRDRWLWLGAVGLTAVSLALQLHLEWTLRPSFWSADGALRSLLFNGLHPVFPWMAFLLVGMGLGRLDLREPALRRVVLLSAVVTFGTAELVDSWARTAQHGPSQALADYAWWWRSWPRPGRPMFVVSGSALAIVAVCGCIEITETRARRAWVVALVATGQLAFTLYLAHAVAILVPMQHGLLDGQPLEVVVAYGLGFYGVAIAASLWWRRRWPYGPIEGLVRQVTNRTDPAPWGDPRPEAR